MRVTPRARTWPASAASGSAAAALEERAPGGIGPRLDDEVAVEDRPGHRGVRRQAGQPAVAGAEMLERGRRRHHLEHRGRDEETAGVQLVDRLDLAALQ